MTGYTGAAGRLTKRQAEVLRLVQDGLNRRQIAAQLGISPETVKAHMTAIRTRLDARNRAQAITNARRNGALT